MTSRTRDTDTDRATDTDTDRATATLDHAMARSQGLDTLLRDLTDRAVVQVPGAVACSVTVRRATG